jgi:hypothetical protein
MSALRNFRPIPRAGRCVRLILRRCLWSGNLRVRQNPLSYWSIDSFARAGSIQMTTTDDFRAQAHELIADLDAATSEMMKLISEHQFSGPEWERVTQWQHEAYERWTTYLNTRSYSGPGDTKANR